MAPRTADTVHANDEFPVVCLLVSNWNPEPLYYLVYGVCAFLGLTPAGALLTRGQADLFSARPRRTPSVLKMLPSVRAGLADTCNCYKELIWRIQIGM